jgi:arabinofuranosyltransferase
MAFRSRLGLAAVVVALVPFLLLVWRFDFVCDDAFISFRYARNLVDGHGLRFNLGPQAPVEGYSEFAWVLLMAAGMKLGLAPELFSRLVSVACAVALIVLACRAITRAAAGRPLATLGAALFLGMLTPLAVWATSGMGTMAFLLAAFGLHQALFGDPERPRPVLAALAAVALVLLRADGALWVAISGGTGLWLGRRRPAPVLLRAALVASVLGAAVFLAQVAWRSSYYGDWLPNTARVKVGLSAYALGRGGLYLLHFLATFPGVALALVLGLVWGKRRAPLVIATLASLAYPVVVGGDFMCFGRFVLPALPLVALLLAEGLAALESRAGRLSVGATATALAVASVLPAYDLHLLPRAPREALSVRYNAPEFRSEYGQWFSMKNNALRWAMVGRGLAMFTLPEASLVTGGIGAVGYFSGRFLYDQNGLVTREVALGPAADERRSPGHDKAVPASFFLKDKPTFLRAFLHDAREPLPPEVRAKGPGRDLVRTLDPAQGFPPGFVLIGLRPRE